jgi:RNA polymerase sigma-70 factor, ECF subfamily
MSSANTLLDAPPVDDIITLGGVGKVPTAAAATTQARQAARGEGGWLSAETGAESGTGLGSGTGARRVLAEELFAANYPKLAGWVRRLVDDDETAHEIASEAFVRLLSRWKNLANLDNPQSYLFMIATNLVRDHWRKTERERRAMRNVTAGADREPVSDPAQDVHVRSLIQDLPPRLRDPFLLHYYAGFGVREIAALLKRPEGTVKADLYHARARLKEALAMGVIPRQPGEAPQSPQTGDAGTARDTGKAGKPGRAPRKRDRSG